MSSRLDWTTKIACVALLGAVACGGGDAQAPPASTNGVLAGSIVDVDSGGSGLAGVSVRLQSVAGTRTVTSDGTGTFRVTDAAAGSWQAEVQLPATHRLDANEAGTRTASVTAGGTATMTPFRLVRPRGSVSGQVVLDGVGTASGSVEARRGGFSSVTGTPQSGGVFTIGELAAGPWTLAYSPGTGHQLGANETGARAVTVVEGQAAVASPFVIRAGSTSTVVEIHLTASQFSPSTITIAPGTTVRWINDSDMDHTITPQNTSQPGVWQRRTTSSAGVVFEHTFTTSGQTYRYRCEPHSSSFDSGMVGMITVS